MLRPRQLGPNKAFKETHAKPGSSPLPPKSGIEVRADLKVSIWELIEEIKHVSLGKEKAKENHIMLTIPKDLKGHHIERSMTYLEGHPETSGKVPKGRI